MHKTLLKRMTALLGLILLAYLAVVGYLLINQRKLIYHPDTTINAPDSYGLSGFTDLRVTSADGLSQQLWYKKAAPGMPTIAYFHGNASNISGRSPLFKALTDKGFGLSAISYRGYGKSQGSPTETGVYEDARASMRYLTDGEHIPLKHIVIFGESLGTGVAVQMATEFDAGALVLQAAYTSVAARAAEIYYYVPVNILIRDRYDSIRKIGRIKMPLLMFHGERDTVIPIKQGRALFEAAPEPKKSYFLPENTHNDFDSQMISSHVLEFVHEHHLGEP